MVLTVVEEGHSPARAVATEPRVPIPPWDGARVHRGAASPGVVCEEGRCAVSSLSCKP